MEHNDPQQANIIDLLGLQALPEEKKQALLEQMGAVLQDRLMDRILSRLTETQKQELDKVIEQDSETAMEAFLDRYAPDRATLMQEEALRMKAEMSADLTAMKKAVATDNPQLGK